MLAQQTEKKSGFPAEPDSKTRTPNHMLAKHIVFFTIISRPTFYTLEEPGIDCKGARIRHGLGLEIVVRFWNQLNLDFWDLLLMGVSNVMATTI